MLSSVVKTACNGPANNALFVLDEERKKPDAEGQEKRRNTFSACLYIYFFFIPLYKWTLLEVFVLTVV